MSIFCLRILNLLIFLQILQYYVIFYAPVLSLSRSRAGLIPRNSTMARTPVAASRWTGTTTTACPRPTSWLSFCSSFCTSWSSFAGVFQELNQSSQQLLVMLGTMDVLWPLDLPVFWVMWLLLTDNCLRNGKDFHMNIHFIVWNSLWHLESFGGVHLEELIKSCATCSCHSMKWSFCSNNNTVLALLSDHIFDTNCSFCIMSEEWHSHSWMSSCLTRVIVLYKNNDIDIEHDMSASFVRKVFSSWDFSITEKKAANIKHKSIFNELKVWVLSFIVHRMF